MSVRHESSGRGFKFQAREEPMTKSMQTLQRDSRGLQRELVPSFDTAKQAISPRSVSYFEVGKNACDATIPEHRRSQHKYHLTY